MGAECRAAFTPFQLPNLKSNNVYQIHYHQYEQSERKSRGLQQQISADSKFIQQNKNLLNYLSNIRNSKFQDRYFIVQGNKLSRLYDYQRKNMIFCEKVSKNGSEIFMQRDVQFSYLSSVLYFLSRHRDYLIDRVLITKQISSKHLYAFRLFCNGQDHTVIIDDTIPVEGDQLKYASLKSKQIWPIMLEKAWCKQIGSYQGALGLSPQDCFQQITGIPAYSYIIDSSNKQQILDLMVSCLKQGQWLCVVARQDLDNFKNSQVFEIESIHHGMVILASPFIDFKQIGFERQKQGVIKLSFEQFAHNFQYLVVGYYKQNYQPVSHVVHSKRREQKVFCLDVDKPEQISIRFTQFYAGYLNDQSKSNYEYSPLILFELYDQNKHILSTCQGCERVFSGVHSSYLTHDIFHHLNAGTYYLRIEVDWLHDKYIQQGDIVVYSSKGNVQLTEEKIENRKNLIQELHKCSLKDIPYTDSFTNKEKDYKITILSKKAQAAASIKNISNEPITLQLNFSNSKNIRIKYATIKSNKLILTIPTRTEKIIEIVPQNVQEQYLISPFDIKIIRFQQGV